MKEKAKRDIHASWQQEGLRVRRDDKEGREWLYGRLPVYETLRAARRKVLRLYLAREVRGDKELEEVAGVAASLGVPVAAADRRQLDALLGRVNHQGIAAEVSPYPYVEFDDLVSQTTASENALLLLLDHLQDPQNVGALMRTADAVGVHGVIIPADRAAGITPAVVRASAGAAEHVKVAVVVNLARVMRELRELGVTVVGLEMHPAARLYTEVDLKPALGLVIGSEERGLGRLVRESCDYMIRIPIFGRVTSLNTSVAGAVALYEVVRQRSGYQCSKTH